VSGHLRGPYHSGFMDESYLYCDACGRSAALGWYGPVFRAIGAGLNQEEVTARFEGMSRPCVCGGRLRHTALPRCPSCHAPLDSNWRGWFTRSGHALGPGGIHYFQTRDHMEIDEDPASSIDD